VILHKICTKLITFNYEIITDNDELFSQRPVLWDLICTKDS